MNATRKSEWLRISVNLTAMLALIALILLVWVSWLLIIVGAVNLPGVKYAASSSLMIAWLLLTIFTGVPWLITFYTLWKWKVFRDELIEPAVTGIIRLLKLLGRW
jgi:hypothetical protein